MKKHYSGNNPNNSNYDPSLPIGYNKWDAQEVDSENENEPDEEIEDEDEGNYGQEGFE
jgi:hypothetical protein